MFITDVQLYDTVAALMKLDAGISGLTTSVQKICTSANSRAYSEIVRRLMARGYSKVQIDAWDAGTEFQMNLGVFWAFQHPSILGGFDRDVTKNYDVRSELSDSQLILTNSYVVQYPNDVSQAGQVSTGPMQAPTNDPNWSDRPELPNASQPDRSWPLWSDP